MRSAGAVLETHSTIASMTENMRLPLLRLGSDEIMNSERKCEIPVWVNPMTGEMLSTEPVQDPKASVFGKGRFSKVFYLGVSVNIRVPLIDKLPDPVAPVGLFVLCWTAYWS